MQAQEIQYLQKKNQKMLALEEMKATEEGREMILPGGNGCKRENFLGTTRTSGVWLFWGLVWLLDFYIFISEIPEKRSPGNTSCSITWPEVWWTG